MNQTLYELVCVELGCAFHRVTDTLYESQSLMMYILQVSFACQIGIAARG